jgi:hypothetical protein
MSHGMPMRLLMVVLAFSPIAFLLCLIGLGFAFDTTMGSLLGDVAIFVPLVFLAFSKNIALSPLCRRSLRWALASLMLLVPAMALHFAPIYSAKFAHMNQIRLDPPPHEMPAEGATFLRGLSVKDGVMILKWKSGEAHDNPSPYSACDSDDWNYPPSHFNDENGNGLDFRLIGADLLHFQDDRGGYADIKWNGKQFILVASHSSGLADSAKAPTAAAKFAGKLGDLLLILSPMLAWLLVTRFALQHSQESAATSPSLVPAAFFQIAGMIVLGFALLSAPATPDEVSGGLLVLILLCALACSLAGLSILGWHLCRLQLQTTP